MKFPTSKPVEVTISFTEVLKGKETQKSFSTDKKKAEGHLMLMKNNPYVKDVRVGKV